MAEARVFRAILLTGLVLIAACQPQARKIGPPDEMDECGAAVQQGLVGKPARVLATMKFAPPTRIIRPGDAVTRDYQPGRMNIEIDLHETIAAVRCG